jgi:uncharacterized membrane protein
MNNLKCHVCQKEFQQDDLISGHGIRHEIETLIMKDHPDWNDFKSICKSDFYIYREKYISNLISEESSNINNLERDVVESINNNELIVENINTSIKAKVNIGDSISDKVASFGGSWKFIIIFFIVFFVWITINSYWVLKKPFDPYPFILMNLILSCIAAIQAPIIMMSQNRQEKKDRLRSENDYKVNLKSEIEIRTLHEKVDHLLLDQWSKLMKIQEIQIEMLEEIRNRIK